MKTRLMWPINPTDSSQKNRGAKVPLSGGDRGYDRNIVKNGQKGGNGQRHKGPERAVGRREPFLDMCLGQSPPVSRLDSFDHFRNEYETRITQSMFLRSLTRNKRY